MKCIETKMHSDTFCHLNASKRKYKLRLDALLYYFLWQPRVNASKIAFRGVFTAFESYMDTKCYFCFVHIRARNGPLKNGPKVLRARSTQLVRTSARPIKSAGPPGPGPLGPVLGKAFLTTILCRADLKGNALVCKKLLLCAAFNQLINLTR